MIKNHIISEFENFTMYELNEILEDGLKVIINMIPKDLLGLVSRDDMLMLSQKSYSSVSPIELLDGDTILSKCIDNP